MSGVGRRDPGQMRVVLVDVGEALAWLGLVGMDIEWSAGGEPLLVF